MPSFQMSGITEPSEFAAAIRGSSIDLAIAGSGAFVADVMDVGVGSLRIRRFSENLPLVLHSTRSAGRATFAFHTEPGESVFRNGIEVTSDAIVRVGQPQAFFQRSVGQLNWGSVSLPLAQGPVANQLESAADLTPRPTDQIITPRSGELANLRRLHATVGMLATKMPELLGNSDAARGLEKLMMHALVGCLDSNNIVEQTPTQKRHQVIMERFYDSLRASSGEPLYVLEIARRAGASLRSLTECCQDYLGMSPKRFLLLRRMYLVRRDLLAAKAAAATVTDVATRHGFWQFGRFAGQYKSLFGETPSRTLRRPPGTERIVSGLSHGSSQIAEFA